LSAGVTGALVPHAPLLLPAVSGEEVSAETGAIREAAATIGFDEVDLVLVLSPHARETGVYRTVAGSLDDFGVPGVELERPTDVGVVETLTATWDKPTLVESVDHGVLVPLMLLATGDTPVVAAGLSEVTAGTASFERAMDDATSFAEAIGELSNEIKILLAVSAQTSCALTPRAPLTERAEAKPAEAAVMNALRGDPATLLGSLEELWKRGGSCSPGTLAVYGNVFEGRASEVFAYQYPFGVGYVVARVT
jgi:Catalytic LigB subunit of aromatic ring-opening dioxygenase